MTEKENDNRSEGWSERGLRPRNLLGGGSEGGPAPLRECKEYAQGEIKSYHGIVNRWLLAVYAILFHWAIYYLFTYWGCLGPGLGRSC